MIQIRAFCPADAAHLPRFLALAAHETEIEAALANPNLARYIGNFGRAGDCAVVAHGGEQIIGIAWARLWTSDNCGFGWVDEQTPEMALAVEADFRNRGIGARLIEALKTHLRESGAQQMSLNARTDSPAVRLYEKLGFGVIVRSERVNRTGGASFSMLARLR